MSYIRQILSNIDNSHINHQRLTPHTIIDYSHDIHHVFLSLIVNCLQDPPQYFPSYQDLYHQDLFLPRHLHLLLSTNPCTVAQYTKKIAKTLLVSHTYIYDIFLDINGKEGFKEDIYFNNWSN